MQQYSCTIAQQYSGTVVQRHGMFTERPTQARSNSTIPTVHTIYYGIDMRPLLVVLQPQPQPKPFP